MCQHLDTWCLAPSPNAHHHADGSSVPHRRPKSHHLPSCPESTCSPLGYCTAMMSQPAPDQTVPGPLTVSHDASARHSKRAPTHPRVACALWERTITPRHLRRRSYSPSYTITPRDSSPVVGRRVDVACLYIDVAL